VAALGIAGIWPYLGWVGFTLLTMGGVIYSLGVPVYLANELPYRAAIWHAMCIAAGACHLGAIWVAETNAAALT
jgi:hemolysin III